MESVIKLENQIAKHKKKYVMHFFSNSLRNQN